MSHYSFATCQIPYLNPSHAHTSLCQQQLDWHKAAGTTAQCHAKVEDDHGTSTSISSDMVGSVAAVIAGEKGVCRHWIRVSRALVPLLQVTPSTLLFHCYVHSNNIDLIRPLQRAAIMVEEAEGQGSGTKPKSRQGPEIGGFGAFGGDSAPAAVGEIAAVIGQVMKLLEETIKNSRKDKSARIISSDAADNVDDGDDEYCCVSDQALVEYATCTILPLLDATLRRYLP